jgi:hypothetical protein
LTGETPGWTDVKGRLKLSATLCRVDSVTIHTGPKAFRPGKADARPWL